MPASEDYATGLLDEPKVAPEATTYEAEKAVVSDPTDTVRGQITSLLDEDSAYLERARFRGEEYAASRGLLNTSIAAGAGETSAIEAALPIAQQDAETYTRQRLENQAAINTALSTNVQLQTQASFKGADISAAERGQALQSLSAADLQRQQENAALLRTQYSELAATERQEIIAMTNTQTNSARIEAEMVMNNQKIGQADRETFAVAFNEITRQNDVEITKIALDPDLTETEKNRLITAQNDRYSSNITLLSGLNEIPITMGDIAAADYFGTTPAPGGTAPAGSAVFAEPTPAVAPGGYAPAPYVYTEETGGGN